MRRETTALSEQDLVVRGIQLMQYAKQISVLIIVIIIIIARELCTNGVESLTRI